MNRTPKKPPREAALPYAVKLLAARSYSERKLREKLRNRGYEVADIDEAIAKLRDRKLLNDDRFAEGFIRTRVESHPRGRTGLVRDLIARGVSASTARHAVQDALSDDQEFEMAKDLVARKARQYSGLEAATRTRRLTALLARRGFRPDTIRRALSLANEPEVSDDAS